MPVANEDLAVAGEQARDDGVAAEETVGVALVEGFQAFVRVIAQRALEGPVAAVGRNDLEPSGRVERDGA